MTVRRRYPSIRVDLSGLATAPLLDRWLLEPDDAKADGAVLAGIVSGHPSWPDGERITTPPVQAIDPGTGWAWTYGQGLWRLGACLDEGYCAGVDL